MSCFFHFDIKTCLYYILILGFVFSFSHLCILSDWLQFLVGFPFVLDAFRFHSLQKYHLFKAMTKQTNKR